jgi:hypothetical protein
MVRYHLEEKQLVSRFMKKTGYELKLTLCSHQEEQYSIQLPRRPSDIFFLGEHAFLVHPEQIVILNLSTGLEVQVIRNPVNDGEFRVLDRPTKSFSGGYEGHPGAILQAGRERDRLRLQVRNDGDQVTSSDSIDRSVFSYKLQYDVARMPGAAVASFSI